MDCPCGGQGRGPFAPLFPGYALLQRQGVTWINGDARGPDHLNRRVR